MPVVCLERGVELQPIFVSPVVYAAVESVLDKCLLSPRAVLTGGAFLLGKPGASPAIFSFALYGREDCHSPKASGPTSLDG